MQGPIQWQLGREDQAKIQSPMQAMIDVGRPGVRTPRMVSKAQSGQRTLRRASFAALDHRLDVEVDEGLRESVAGLCWPRTM